MVKITYDEKNEEEYKLVSDYYWLKYYLDVIEFDILRNDELTSKIVLNSYKKFSWDNFKSIDDEYANKEEINIIYSFSNKQDLNKFTELMNILMNYCFDHNLDETLTLITCILELRDRGKKEIIKIYKSLLVEKFGEK